MNRPKPPQFSSAEVRQHLNESGYADAAVAAEQIAQFLTLLAKWNDVHNLTGFRDTHRLLDRNLLECLTLRPVLAGDRIADVGTGAGLPGLPLAITEPDRQFTLIESRAKRAAFLTHVVGELGLTNVSIEHSRAEDLPKHLGFATVLARAVAAPLELLKISRHLSAPGSILVLLTSPERGAEYRGLATDFMLREIRPAGADGRFGAIVILDRIA